MYQVISNKLSSKQPFYNERACNYSQKKSFMCEE